MKSRDWVLAGTAFGFGGVGLTCWTAGGTVSLFGVAPLLMGLAALYELANGQPAPEQDTVLCPSCGLLWEECEEAS